MSARHRILQRLREAHRPTSWPAVKIEASTPANAALQREKFCHALQNAHAEVIECDSERWPQLLTTLAKERRWMRWLVGQEVELIHPFEVACGLHSELTLCHYNAPVETLDVDLFSDVDAALTTVKAGIAETGTLVLWPDEQEPRQMSLVPPVHVAILRASDIYASFAQLISKQAWADNGMPTNALLISGPSKTADIQQTLAYGAHGPKILLVFVLRDR
ncbi:MAG: lactate utilization protein [Hahellaceae bacterium]|nr:lactate utilization protein [Hahellaceae bacterium]MCP5168780.1 lactate utilization protein [Hahellaceae bacterium]